MRRILQAILCVFRNRGRTNSRTRLDWRGRPPQRTESEPASAKVQSGNVCVSPAVSAFDTLVPSMLLPPAQPHKESRGTKQ
jgi:hypothetical protein